MSDIFEKADELIKRAAGAPKTEYKAVNYAYKYGQLAGGIKLLSAYLDHPELLREYAAKLVKREQEISAEVAAEQDRNMEALKL